MENKEELVILPRTVVTWLSQLQDHFGELESRKQLENYQEIYEKYSSYLRLYTKDDSKILKIYEIADKIMEDHLKLTGLAKRVSCKRGCHECCRMYVAVSPSEVMFILKVIKNRPLDWEAVLKQARLPEDGYWSSKVGDVNRCVFLDKKGSCSIYKVRPLSCRVHLVVGDKKFCDMKEENIVQKVFCPEAEAFLHAYADDDGGVKLSLPQALLKFRGVDT